MSLATRLCNALNSRELVTWERTDPAADVLIVTNAWPHPERPVLGTFVQTTVDGLTARGVHCDVLLIRGYRGLRAYVLGCLMMVLLPRKRRSKYRLVHSHGGEAALVARFFLGAPVLASYLGSDILAPQEGTLAYRVMSTLRGRLIRFHSLLMSATTTKSNEMARLLPKHSQRTNWIIPDGVDRSHFVPLDRDSARRRLGWPIEETVVISVGRRVPLKRLWLAEESTALVAKDVPHLRWFTISDVPPSDMPLYYNAADCLIHTSASEGSPNVIKEALACDLPVVATPAGDVAELLNGVTPSAVCGPNPELLAREIKRCVSDKKRSDGREHTGHLALEKITGLLLDCYAVLGVDSPIRETYPRA